MKKVSLILPVALASVLTASAVQLSPEAALQRVQSQCPQMAKAPGTASWQLGHTFMRPGDDASPAMYLYTRPKNGGFLILAADDAVSPVIGYSDSGTIDPANLPPALQWWLDGCALTIKQAAARPISYGETEDIVDIATDDTDNLWKPVAPIVKTRWDQDYPYNQQCPEINGRKAYTGCVATAMAQLANVHQWPEKGVGYREYTFTYEGEKYTDSFDFANTPFAWDQMLDTYDWDSTPESCDAVASLMHACGVAAQMRYGYNGSSADSFDAAQGLVTWLNYDKGIKWLSRDWFSEDDWIKTIYSEIYVGQPVMMGGVTIAGEGHAFVCDGYSTDGFFHINWGWGGLADGYYSLYALNPDEQGIGGSQTNNGYNFQLSAVTGIRPPVEGSEYAPVIYNDNFTTSEAEYPRNKNGVLPIICAIGNNSLVTMECEYGLRLVTQDGKKTVYVPWMTRSLDPHYYFNQMLVPSMDIPVGKWVVSPVYRIGEGEWQDMYYNRTKHGNSFNLEVTDDEIQVVGAPIAFHVEFLGMEAANPDDEAVMNGHTYNVSYSITSNGAWTGPLYCLLYGDYGQKDKILVTEAKVVEFAKATTITETWTITIPAGLPVLPGQYSILLASRQPSKWDLYSQYDVMIQLDPDVPRPGQIVRTDWLEFGDASQRYYPGRTYDLRVEYTTDGFCEYANTILALYKDGRLYCVSDSKNLKFTGAETLTEVYTLAIPSRVEPGNYGLYFGWNTGGSSYNLVGSPWNITISPVQELESKLTAAFTGWVPVEEGLEAMYPGHAYDFSYDVSAEGPWHGSLECAVVSPDGECVSSTVLSADFNDSDTRSATWTVELSEDMPVGDCMLRLVATRIGGEPEVIDMRTLTISSGIASVLGDPTDVRYYDLQGVPVDNPRAGGVYIRVTPAGAVKILSF